MTGSAGQAVPPYATELHGAAWRPADLAYAQLAREIPGLRVSRYFGRQRTRRVESRKDLAEMTDALARLGREVIAVDYAATLAVRGGLWRPSLVVRNPAVAVRTTEIIAEAGWFWWPEAYQLGPMADPAGAARMIVNVLRLGPEPGR